MIDPAVPIRFPARAPRRKARFVRRVNRFLAEVELDGVTTEVHVPNTGRMKELLVPGAPVYLERRRRAGRRTEYSLVLVSDGTQWVSTDAAEANRVVEHLIERWAGCPPRPHPRDPEAAVWHSLAGLQRVQKDVQLHGARIDFRGERNGRPVWIEVKSVNLVIAGCALFPDAPTVRGRHHVERLAEEASRGSEAHVHFVVLRDDAVCFRPHRAQDPAFADALERAAASGVGIHSFALRVTPEGMELTRSLPVTFV